MKGNQKNRYQLNQAGDKLDFVKEGLLIVEALLWGSSVR